MNRLAAKASAVLAASIVVLLLSACGEGGNAPNPSQGSVPASATVSPPSGAALSRAQAIVLLFDRSMDPATLVRGGTLAADANSVSWSDVAATNDRLTIAPTSTWSGGNGSTLHIEVRDASGVPAVPIELIYDIDATPPSVLSILPADGSTISTTQQIVVRFSETMAAASLSLTGSLADESTGGVWDTTTVADDTLAISPMGKWSGGAGRTLALEATDAAGNPVPKVSLRYTVDVTAPTAQPSVPDGSIITKNRSIVISFSKTIDRTSLVLGGSLAADSNGGVWSTTTQVDDTLTIAPATVWSVGIKTLTVQAADPFRNTIRLSLSFDSDVVFVATTGLETNAGTHSKPLKTIQAGLDKAASLGVGNVWVQIGNYNEVVTLANGVNVKGGHDSVWNWNVANIPNTTLGGGRDATDFQWVTVRARSLSSPTKLSALTLRGPNAGMGANELCSNAACSSYVVHVVDSRNLSLEQLTIVSGIAGNGLSGASAPALNLPAPQSGLAGGNAREFNTSCDNSSRGAGGLPGGSGSRAGGAGGAGGTMDTSCDAGVNNDLTATSGTQGNDAVVTSANLGRGGPRGGACSPGGPGNAASVGNDGSGGRAATVTTGVVSNDYWLPQGDGSAGAAGIDGGGGGGGGGSGGCDTGIDSYGAGGGGGGAGGRGNPQGGGSGRAGGSSFGVFAVRSSLALTNITISRGKGGDGGVGGNGAAGQNGSSGGDGGLGAGGSLNGGRGGDGGRGGHSGGGAGGSGGSSYASASIGGSTINLSNVLVQGLTTGLGGRGGTSPGNDGGTGQDGALREHVAF